MLIFVEIDNYIHIYTECLVVKNTERSAECQCYICRENHKRRNKKMNGNGQEGKEGNCGETFEIVWARQKN